MDKELINQEKSISAMCKFLLWLFCALVISFVGISGVFADTYTNVAELRDTTQVLVTLDGSPGQPVSVSPNSDVTMNYVTEISYILQNYNFLANQNYQLESHLARQQLTYANSYSVYGANGEQCLISYQYSIFQDEYPRWAFQCTNPTTTVTITIRNSSGGYLWNNTPTAPNWNIFNWQTALLKTGDFSLSGNSQNNDNQNTQNIINNQNQNTQDIINNQNQNTQDIINSNQVCYNVDKNNVEQSGYFLNENGEEISNSGYGITSYFKINSTSKINVVYARNDSAALCFYNVNKSLISCTKDNQYTLGQQVSIPTNADYFRATINLGDNKPTYQICTNGNQAVSDKLDEQEKTSKGIFGKLKDLFDTLFSDDDADVSGLNNMVGWLPAGPVDSIINLPLALFNALLNTITGTCSSVTLTLPFVQQTLTLPCFDAFMSQYITGFSTLWTLVGTIASVFILYNYLLSLYKWIDDTLTLRENNLPGYYDDNWGGGA